MEFSKLEQLPKAVKNKTKTNMIKWFRILQLLLKSNVWDATKSIE